MASFFARTLAASAIARDTGPSRRMDGTTIHATGKAVMRYRAGRKPVDRSTGLAPKTVRNIHRLIHRVLSDAVAWRYIGFNPAARILTPCEPR